MNNKTTSQPTLEVYEYDKKLLQRSALEPYLYNKFLKELSIEIGHSVQDIVQNHEAKERIEREVESKISQLEAIYMTHGEYLTARAHLVIKKHPAREEAIPPILSDSEIDDALMELDEIAAEHQEEMKKPPETQEREVTSETVPKKSSFTAPKEYDAIYGIEEGEDHTQLYGKVGYGDDENPGAKILACLNSPNIIPPEHREKFIRYRQSGISVLQQELSKVEPKNYNVSARNKFYLISLLLSEKGVAPRWREYKRAFIEADSQEDNPELVYSRDVQLFDLEWIRRKYPRHKPSKRMNGLYVALTDSEEFDFNHAFIISSSKFTSEEKAKQLRLGETMQLDNFIIRSRQVDRRAKKLENDMDEVHTDLLEACQRNRHRGAQLEKQIPERLSIWLSAQLTQGNSISAMCDRYQKITGSKISPSSFRRKFRRTQAALLEVDSSHFIRELVNL